MDSLVQPLGRLMRPTFMVDLHDSIEMAARKLRENGCGILPVLEDGQLAGVLDEAALAGALGRGLDLQDPVSHLAQGGLTAPPSATGAEALRLFDQSGRHHLVVVDEAGRVLGVITPSDLFPKRLSPPRPPLVGGMATPFGVYLTTGSLRAGVGDLALISTGVLLFGLYLFGAIATGALVGWLRGAGVTEGGLGLVGAILPALLFLGGMRLLPLSGIHAAEHKVVHAIERGEELAAATVRRMPRVHPRCGTNIAVGASLFLSLGNARMLPHPELQLVFAALVTLVLWRPLGNAVQYYITTRPPSERHIQMGIRSGVELLHRYANRPSGPAPFWKRIYCSGMLQVIAGSMIALGLTQLALWLLGLPLID